MLKIDLSIIVVTYNTEKVTIDCIASIYKSKTSFEYEIIVVDNNSSDDTVSKIKQLYPALTLIASDKNNGFSKGNNIGIDVSKGKHILLLNSDTILFEDSIDNLMQSALNNNYDITGPILLNTDYTIQRSWFNFPSSLKVFLRLTDIYLIFYKLSNSFLFKLFYPNQKPAFMINEIKVDTKMNYLSFACILIKKDIIEKIGNLDEGLIFYHEDCEYGIRSQKHNYNFMYCVNAKIIHLGGTSSSGSSVFSFENDIRGLLHVYKKHYSVKDLKKMKLAISLALSWRIFFWNFGYYKQLKKIGLYDDKLNIAQLKNSQIELYKKYKELKKEVLIYA